MQSLRRRVDSLCCLRCGHEPLSRQGPIARCEDCGRGYPLRRPGLVDFLPEQDDDDRRGERLINPIHWARKSLEIYEQRVAPPDAELQRIMGERCGGVLLHLGCGPGLVLDSLAEHPWRLRIGVARKLPRLLKAHRRDHAGKDLLLLRCSPYRLPLRDGLVDVALWQNPFVELKDPQAALFEATRVLAPGGTIVTRAAKHHEARLEAIFSVTRLRVSRRGLWWLAEKS